MALKAIELPETAGGVNAKVVADILKERGPLDSRGIRAAWAEVDKAYAAQKPAGQAAKITGAVKILREAKAIKEGKDGTMEIKARVVGPSWQTLKQHLAAA